MLDDAVKNRIRGHIDAELGPREATLSAELADIRARMNARGLLHSSVAIREYARAACAELSIRAEQIWFAVRRAHASMVGTLSADTLDDLRREIGHYVAEHTERVMALANRMAGTWAKGSAAQHITEEVTKRSAELIAKLNVEVQYYADDLGRAATAAGANDSNERPAVNIYGPVGAVQMGSNATAHVSMAGAEGDRLRAAIEGLLRAIETNGEIGRNQRDEALDMLRDTTIAARAERPNAPKIAGLLAGVGTVVRTVASLRPAWDAVKDAATAIGYYLQ